MDLITSTNRLRDAAGRSRVVVLLTDGENNRGTIDPRTAAQAAAAEVGVMTRVVRQDGTDFAVTMDYNINRLNLELKGKAPTLASIMHKANGKVDLAVWPKDLRLGVFNLWSVNLVLNLLPLIDPGGASRVNCVVGRFDLQDGRLSDDKFLIDTTRVRVLGAGQADLASEELAFVFRPRAKGLAVFRLQTPLRVSGTLTDQRFGLDRRDVVESTLRMIASPILLPIDWLVNGPLPRDGADVCTDPLRAASASH